MVALLLVALVPLKVTVVEDTTLPALTSARVERILSSAQSAYTRDLEPSSISFAVTRRMTPETYFASLDQDTMHDCLSHFASSRADAITDYDRPSLVATVITFLQRWPLPTLSRAFPEEVHSYDQAARRLISEMRRSAVAARASGLLSAKPGRRFTDWLCAMEAQRDDDVVLSNVYVFYDLASEPYPHTVFHHTRLSGAAMFSAAREPMFGRAVFVSSFSEEPLNETASSDDFVGTYLLAHELGHAILKIPDVYDHGPDCLMNTSFAPSYADGYAALRARVQTLCPKCRAYREAHASVLDMQAALARNDFPLAERKLERAVATLPPLADGDALSYKSKLYLRVAGSELTANRLRQAELFAYRASTLDPANDEARILLRRIRARLALPASR